MIRVQSLIKYLSVTCFFSCSQLRESSQQLQPWSHFVFKDKFEEGFLLSKACKGNDTASCVKSMKLGAVVSFKILIQNFEGATFLGHVTDDFSSLYKGNFSPAKQVILHIVGNQILC